MHYTLVEEIIIRSVSKDWHTAKTEWYFESAYKSMVSQTCLCTHHPIFNICIIRNKLNNELAEVGNCCINKFLGIDEANKIFDSVNRLKKDITKSMSPETAEYLINKKVINEFEFNFYKDIHRKRKLSYRQLEIKKMINRKFIRFVIKEENSNLTKINLVLDWAKDVERPFDLTFINSLKTYCERTGNLTEKQKNALENIIQKWQIA
jgi:hypothetical protein